MMNIDKYNQQVLDINSRFRSGEIHLLQLTRINVCVDMCWKGMVVGEFPDLSKLGFGSAERLLAKDLLQVVDAIKQEHLKDGETWWEHWNKETDHSYIKAYKTVETFITALDEARAEYDALSVAGRSELNYICGPVGDINKYTDYAVAYKRGVSDVLPCVCTAEYREDRDLLSEWEAMGLVPKVLSNLRQP